MKPISPVVKGFEDLEVVFAKDQPEYLPLPALQAGDQVITRWKLSWRERLKILFLGDLYLTLLTFKRPLQPISLSLDQPELQRVQG